MTHRHERFIRPVSGHPKVLLYEYLLITVTKALMIVYFCSIAKVVLMRNDVNRFLRTQSTRVGA